MNVILRNLCSFCFFLVFATSWSVLVGASTASPGSADTLVGTDAADLAAVLKKAVTIETRQNQILTGVVVDEHVYHLTLQFYF